MIFPGAYVVVGDITNESVDAIVNAANTTLMGGSGVDGAIHAAGGPDVLAQCREIRHTSYPHGLPVGHAVATTGGSLGCRWIIHTVGPIFESIDQLPLLESCYLAAMSLAGQLGATGVAFPLIGAGVYGWPLNLAARAAIVGVRRSMAVNENPPLVRFVLFQPEIAEIFCDVAAEVANGSKST